MFIRQQEFKKLLKVAVKKGDLNLYFSNTVILITSEFFQIELDRLFIPKDMLGVIIGFAGRIPKVGECITLGEFGEQTAMPVYQFPDPAENEDIEYLSETPFVISTSGEARILQNRESGRIYLIPEMISKMCDQDLVDVQSGETSMDGPAIDPEGWVYWWNERAKVRFWSIRRSKYETILGAMQHIDLMEEDER
ncbi:MAG: hypothetical protein J6040_02695 [Clostridiales bacterium]|nr:hypothetical protein [Clostridiales bacterium]